LCVGNLTAGGTGKTPVAIALGRMLAARGAKIFFLTRGYGGSETGPVRFVPGLAAGDEAQLLSEAAPTIIARDRAAGARLADADGADIIIMDDGFQNFSLAKDLAFVVIDAETGLGNGRMIPAGPLREPIAAGLARADALIMMGKDEASRISGFPRPVLRAQLRPKDDGLRGTPVIAFAGIGRPEKFFQTLRGLGALVRAERSFADHHVFQRSELASLRAEAESAHAALVTTEKDYVRIPPHQRTGIMPVPVEASFVDLPTLNALLDRLWPRPEEPQQ
jgi:tetraacyldisaccharide 4'-kinase